MTRQRGFALLIVLWTMGLLALLVSQFTTSGRTETRIAANLRANAAVQAAADGALYEAILRLIQGVWAPDGHVHVIRVEGGVVEIHISNQATKLNPNMASAPVLQRLMTTLGIDPGKAGSLAQAMVDWRSAGPRSLSGGSKLSQYQAAGLSYGPANQRFDSVEEIGQVVGMTPALVARIKPFLSVYQESDAAGMDDSQPGVPDRTSATDRDGWYFGSTGRVMVVAVSAEAVGLQGGRFTRGAIVRLRADPSLDQAPYELLTWETGLE
jgi:general secretion pathway protein K